MSYATVTEVSRWRVLHAYRLAPLPPVGIGAVPKGNLVGPHLAGPWAILHGIAVMRTWTPTSAQGSCFSPLSTITETETEYYYLYNP